MERVENPGHIRQVRAQRGGVPTRRLLRLRADRLSDRHRARITAALDAGDPHNEVTAAWLIAQQLMGAYGYSKQYPAERRMRDAWGWGIAGGAIDIQKVNIAAAMLGRRFDQRR